VYIAETSTDKVPNASPTAASASSDLYGGAVLDACRQLNERLAPVRAKLGEGAPFGDICNAAYFGRIDLSAHGWFVTPDLVWEWDGSKAGTTQSAHKPHSLSYMTSFDVVSVVSLGIRQPPRVIPSPRF